MDAVCCPIRMFPGPRLWGELRVVGGVHEGKEAADLAWVPHLSPREGQSMFRGPSSSAACARLALCSAPEGPEPCGLSARPLRPWWLSGAGVGCPGLTAVRGTVPCSWSPPALMGVAGSLLQSQALCWGSPRHYPI